MSFSDSQDSRRSSDRHGWNSLTSYLDAHHGYLRALEYFIEDNGLEIRPVGPETLQISGSIRCQHDLVLHVNKLLRINVRRQVRTTNYSYHACWGEDGSRPIFRYDNAHEYGREGHPDPHHKHLFSTVTWKEIQPPAHVGYEHWPTLGDVIQELADWWEETGRFLDDPDR